MSCCYTDSLHLNVNVQSVGGGQSGRGKQRNGTEPKICCTCTHTYTLCNSTKDLCVSVPSACL